MRGAFCCRMSSTSTPCTRCSITSATAVLRAWPCSACLLIPAGVELARLLARGGHRCRGDRCLEAPGPARQPLRVAPVAGCAGVVRAGHAHWSRVARAALGGSACDPGGHAVAAVQSPRAVGRRRMPALRSAVRGTADGRRLWLHAAIFRSRVAGRVRAALAGRTADDVTNGPCAGLGRPPLTVVARAAWLDRLVGLRVLTACSTSSRRLVSMAHGAGRAAGHAAAPSSRL